MSETNENMKDRKGTSETWTNSPHKPGSTDEAEGLNRLIENDPADDRNKINPAEDIDEDDVAEKIVEGGVASAVEKATREYNLTPHGLA
jgi:hypothetical protein